MKNNFKLFILLFATSFGVSTGYTQESTNASGGEASGSGGTVAYSIGQIVYSTDTSTTGKVNQGVQQPYELYFIGLPEEANSISLKVYPNPTTNYLNIEVEDFSNDKLNYQLMDMQGKIVSTGIISSSKSTIDLSAFTNGLYLLNITNKSNSTKTIKIIKN